MAANFEVGKTGDLSADTLAKWIAHRVTGDILEVPFIADKVAEKLAAHGVTTTYQLIGKMLTLKQSDMNSQQWCDAFFQWLAEAGVNTNRAKLVLIVAEKCAVSFPSIFDRRELDSEA